MPYPLATPALRPQLYQKNGSLQRLVDSLIAKKSSFNHPYRFCHSCKLDNKDIDCAVSGGGLKRSLVFGFLLLSPLLGMLLVSPLASRGMIAASSLTLPAGFVDELVTGALLSPRAFAFTPDGRILITERGSVSSDDINFASIRVFKNGVLLPQRALTLNVCGDGERGLLGLAVDPAFLSNGYVYIYYTRQAESGPPCAYGTYEQGQPGPRNRVSRFTMIGDAIDPASEAVLIDHLPSDSGIHNAGDLHFGDDGYLYISVGDSNLTSPFPPSTVAISQDLTRLGGKILRILPAAGAPDGYVTTGNPFDTAPNAWKCGPLRNPPGSGSGACREIFAYGFRNPFRFTMSPGASVPFVGDVGGGVWEEIDEVTPGGNYGYPMREGPCPGGVLCIPADGSEPPPEPPQGLTNPIYFYAHQMINSNVDSAVILGDFYTGASFPSEYWGNLFFADYVRGFIRRLVYSQVDLSWRAISPDFATGGTGIIGLRTGADGNLYYLSYSSDQRESELRRIRYAPGVNQKPVAVASVTPLNGALSTVYTFSAAGSYDPDGNLPLVYHWDFGDGTPLQTTSNLTIQHTYSAPGAKTVSLTVTDFSGLDSIPMILKVFPGNTPASAKIVLRNLSAPGRTAGYYAGDTWAFSAENVTDDSPLPADPYRWDVVFHHRTHTHPFLSGLNGQSGQFSIPTLGETDPVVWYEVVLRVTDSQGQVSTITQELHPLTVSVTLSTSPAGGQLWVDGSAFVTPITLRRVVGLQMSVEAPVNQSIYGIPFTFGGWSHGGERAQVIAVPADDRVFQAVYRAPYTLWLSLVAR